jgi:hypothetical protein
MLVFNIDVNQLLLLIRDWLWDRKTRRTLREIKEQLIDVLSELEAWRMEQPTSLGRPRS